MYKIFPVAFPVALLASVSLLCGCEDDRDDNPTLGQATEFVLNSPSFASQTVDLSASSVLNFSWSQPNWGFPLAVNYSMQVSKDGNFTVSSDEAEADESGVSVPDYYQFSSVSSTRAELTASQMAEALEHIYLWASDDDVPESQDVYVRCVATPTGTSNMDKYSIASNVEKISVNPYYVALSAADPEVWYLIGACIGDGSWGSQVGSAIYPLMPSLEQSYDAKSGQGIISSVGYFTTDGFKMVLTPGSWDNQWGQGDAFGSYDKNNGGSSNISVPQNGYYTISLNTAKDELSIVEYEGTPTVYESMLISGSFNDWGEAEMSPVNTVEGVNNHIWFYELDASDEAVECKFLQSGWSPNWGSADFPYGKGVSNGSNIPVPQGNWYVFFNDIDGSYFFLSK